MQTQDLCLDQGLTYNIVIALTARKSNLPITLLYIDRYNNVTNKPNQKLEISEPGVYLVIKEDHLQKKTEVPASSQSLEFLSYLGNDIFTVGFLIKHFRERKGWTLRKLDKETGVAFSQISKFENGKAEPEQVSIDKLIVGLGDNFEKALAILNKLKN